MFEHFHRSVNWCSYSLINFSDPNHIARYVQIKAILTAFKYTLVQISGPNQHYIIHMFLCFHIGTHSVLNLANNVWRSSFDPPPYFNLSVFSCRCSFCSLLLVGDCEISWYEPRRPLQRQHDIPCFKFLAFSSKQNLSLQFWSHTEPMDINRNLY